MKNLEDFRKREIEYIFYLYEEIRKNKEELKAMINEIREFRVLK